MVHVKRYKYPQCQGFDFFKKGENDDVKKSKVFKNRFFSS